MPVSKISHIIHSSFGLKIPFPSFSKEVKALPRIIPPLKKGSCEKIRDSERGASESLRNFLKKSHFRPFLHSFREIKGDFSSNSAAAILWSF